jgi:hypothetical protein
VNELSTARPRSSDCENPAPLSALGMSRILEQCVDNSTSHFNTLTKDFPHPSATISASLRKEIFRS